MSILYLASRWFETPGNPCRGQFGNLKGSFSGFFFRRRLWKSRDQWWRTSGGEDPTHSSGLTVRLIYLLWRDAGFSVQSLFRVRNRGRARFPGFADRLLNDASRGKKGRERKENNFITIAKWLLTSELKLRLLCLSQRRRGLFSRNLLKYLPPRNNWKTRRESNVKQQFGSNFPLCVHRRRLT